MFTKAQFVKSPRREGCLGELVAPFPLAPIEDERSYACAIQVLDRLFLLNREKNRHESDYFQALAQFAYEYESRK